MRERVRPVLLRRRKHHVETELPERTDRNHFVKLPPAMRGEYDEMKQQVSKLVQASLRRPLTKKEQDLLMIFLGMMRMICDSPSIIKNRDCEDCPKMKELAGVLDNCLSDPDVKVIIFSEWEERAIIKDPKIQPFIDRLSCGGPSFPKCRDLFSLHFHFSGQFIADHLDVEAVVERTDETAQRREFRLKKEVPGLLPDLGNLLLENQGIHFQFIIAGLGKVIGFLTEPFHFNDEHLAQITGGVSGG